MRSWTLRAMRFDVRPIEDGTSNTRWHWFVYECAGLDFVRNGQTVGQREDAEGAARAAIAVMGGIVTPPEPNSADSDGGTYRAAGRSRPEVDDP